MPNFRSSTNQYTCAISSAKASMLILPKIKELSCLQAPESPFAESICSEKRSREVSQDGRRRATLFIAVPVLRRSTRGRVYLFILPSTHIQNGL